MATGTLISVDEYLRTSYSPDKEYVDGILVERNVGEKREETDEVKMVGESCCLYSTAYRLDEEQNRTRSNDDFYSPPGGPKETTRYSFRYS